MRQMNDWKEIGRATLGLGHQKAPPIGGSDEPAIHATLSGGRLSVAGAQQHLGAYGGANAIDWVMDGLDLITDTAASAHYHFERDGQKLVPVKTPGMEDEIEEAPGDLANLFREPNPWQTWAELLTLLIIDRTLVGNAFWLKFGQDDQGKPLALYRLHPERVRIIPGAKRLVDRYEYDVPGASVPIKYKPEQVVHFRRPNPHNEHTGLGVVAGAPRVYDAELAMVEASTAFYENGTRLSGIIESDRAVPPAVFQKIKRQIATMYAGAHNAWKVPVLERGLTWKNISSNAQQAEYKTMMPWSRDRILASLRAPRILLGLTESMDRASVREATRIFDNKTMRTLLDQLQATISKELTRPGWNLDFVFDYEYVMPIEDQIDLAQSFAALPGVTVREVREQVGLKPLGPEETDEKGKVIDDIVLNLPGQNDNASKIKDRALGSEPGRPPNGENTGSFNGNSGDPDAMVR